MFGAWLCQFQRQQPFPCAYSNEATDDDIVPPSERLQIGPLPAVGKYVPEPAHPPDRSTQPSFRRHRSSQDVKMSSLRHTPMDRRARAGSLGSAPQGGRPRVPPPIPVRHSAGAGMSATRKPAGLPPRRPGEAAAQAPGRAPPPGGDDWKDCSQDESDEESDSDEMEEDHEGDYLISARVTCGPYSPDIQKGTVVFHTFYQPPRPREGESAEQINARTHPDMVIPTRAVVFQGRNPNKAILFKIGTGAVAFKVVLNTFKAAGLQHTSGDNWNVLWTKRVDPWEWGNLSFYQRVNHFPGTWGIGRKDQLHRNINKLRASFPEHFDITPKTWLLPQDTRAVSADMQAHPGSTYILKPCASSCGKGIRLITKLPENRAKAAVLQRYIANPFLIDGRKFDIRLYVALTSIDPLRLYIFDEGLCRFTAERYPGAHSNLQNQLAHLTNYSINKTALIKRREEEAKQNGGDTSQRDIKWTLSELRAWFEAQGERGRQQWNYVRAQVEDVVIKALISIEGDIMTAAGKVCRYPNAHGCFEIFGFDVMLDSALKATLIEVNIMPSLATGSPLDKAVKNRLLAHILTLIGIMPTDRSKWQEEEAAGNMHHPQTKEEYPYHAQGLMAQVMGPTRRSSQGQPRKRHDARSFMEGLSDDDRRCILEAEAELHRCGGFRRVFPTPQTYQRYAAFFEHQRHYNDLLARWEYEKDKERERVRREARTQGAPQAREGMPETGWDVPIPRRMGPEVPPGFMSSLAACRARRSEPV
eukprot:Hpha_TRINITY_DN9666_c0_g1::TRINITY_DN9666_c0_g1_i1::g.184566::m.184566/K16601/TTLL4; tubulin polyglutamylase TTLL4